jgi:hypothetical protein
MRKYVNKMLNLRYCSVGVTNERFMKYAVKNALGGMIYTQSFMTIC